MLIIKFHSNGIPSLADVDLTLTFGNLLARLGNLFFVVNKNIKRDLKVQ